jgi:hypothetical protein
MVEEFLAHPNQFWRDYHAWAIGFVLIGLNTYTRFNIPPTSRSSTTWGRYHTAAVTYMVVMIAGWITLANTPDILVSTRRLPDLPRLCTQPWFSRSWYRVSNHSGRPTRSCEHSSMTGLASHGKPNV